MSMDAELYARVRKLEKQVEALLERHPEVRSVLERQTFNASGLHVSYFSSDGPQNNPVTPGMIEREASERHAP